MEYVSKKRMYYVVYTEQTTGILKLFLLTVMYSIIQYPNTFNN